MIERLDRRKLLLGVATLTFGAPLIARAAPDRALTLHAADCREIAVSLWRPATVRAVAVFSHGSGGRPENYPALLTAWRDAGILVIAPLHVDSLQHPRRTEFDRLQTFRARLADVEACVAAAAELAPGAPVAVAGHSFGGLMALVAGGGFPPLVDAQMAGVKAVVAYSTAGKVPNIVGPQSYAGLNRPMLLVTGDHDVVDPIIPDWHEHLYPFETSPAGDKLALTFSGAGHNLIGGGQGPGAAGPAAMAAGADFILAHAAGDVAARARLDALTTTDALTVARR